MKRLTRAVGAAFAALTLSATGLVATITPASAAATGCPSGYACLWLGGTPSGSRWQGQNANPTLPSWISNKGNYLHNNGNSCNVVWHSGTNYAGWHLLQEIGDQYSVLNSEAYNNDIESMNWRC
jgi:hypothetical protein